MGALTRLVDRLAPVEPPSHPLAGSSEAERRALVQGRSRPRRRTLVRPDEPSPLASGPATMLRHARGVSNEAVHLFDTAQRAGGSICLEDIRWANTRLADFLDLAKELAHFDLASLAVEGAGVRRRSVLTIPPAFAEVILVSGGWNRWEGLR